MRDSWPKIEPERPSISLQSLQSRRSLRGSSWFGPRMLLRATSGMLLRATSRTGPRTAKPKLLALHGWSSNQRVTQIQLKNIGLFEQFRVKCLEGAVRIRTRDADPNVAALVDGPFYAWFEREPATSLSADVAAVQRVLHSLLDTVRRHGPFDAVYGFSQGAAVVTLLLLCQEDETFRQQFLTLESQTLLAELQQQHQESTGSVLLFDYAILGCSAPDLALFRAQFGFAADWGPITQPSFHLIGANDEFKAVSERNAGLFAKGPQRVVRYFPGAHTLSAELQNEVELIQELQAFATCRGVLCDTPATLEFRNISPATAVALAPGEVVEFVKYDRSQIPAQTVLQMLRLQSSDKPCLRCSARAGCITYGELGRFIGPKGLGDLRRIGVQSGQVVMYVCPGIHSKGTNIEAAVAFLTMCSQAVACPFAKDVTRSEVWQSVSRAQVLDMIDQYQADHLVFFDQVDSEPAEAAAKHWLQTPGNRPLQIHHAVMLDESHEGYHPGLFRFRDDPPDSWQEQEPLATTAESVSLMLRTSGTTARPKGVPILLGQLVRNGYLLASSVGLAPEDVCLNAMPLFHIGGISASLMATLAAGSSVTCLSQFSPDLFVAALGDKLEIDGAVVHASEGTVTPTWYSSVPTIHNSVVNFIKETLHCENYCQNHTLRFIRSGAAAITVHDARNLQSMFSRPLEQRTRSYNEGLLLFLDELKEIAQGLSALESAQCFRTAHEDSLSLDAITVHLKEASIEGIHAACQQCDKLIRILDTSVCVSAEESCLPCAQRVPMMQKLSSLKQRVLELVECTLNDVVPIRNTYSMSEQMPICQPPLSMKDQLFKKPGSVGMPVAASMAVVDALTLRPVMHGEEGVVCISGDTVMRNYLENPEADAKSYFILSTPFVDVESHAGISDRFFITGDVGKLDSEGHLSLSGRSKELIKRGGEQVSPAEVEELLALHPSIKLCLVFSVPSDVWGEEVGAALVLRGGQDGASLISELKTHLRTLDLAPSKIPSCWWIGDEDALPKTSTKKYRRVGLAEFLTTTLQWDPKKLSLVGKVASRPPPKVSAATQGLRFFLALWVMYIHYGDFPGTLNDGRRFSMQMPTFFALAGFGLAQTMSPPTKNKWEFTVSRFLLVHPIYVLSVLCCLINFIPSCKPSDLETGFHWGYKTPAYNPSVRDPSDNFCETPWVGGNWYTAYFSSAVVYLFGLQAWFAWPVTWFIGYYHWFSSVYYFCLLVYPHVYEPLHTLRGNSKKLVGVAVGTTLLNWCCAAVFLGLSWGLESSETRNGTALGLYLFPVFWLPMFLMGVITAFLLDSYNPSITHNKRYWGYITDVLALLMLGAVVLNIAAGDTVTPGITDDDDKIYKRVWTAALNRILAPIMCVFLFGLAVGEGYVARLLASEFIVQTLAPASYCIYLFHCPVGQWYYMITRGQFWSWHNWRKSYYWFSPMPLPVPWYEAIYVMILTVFLSLFLTAHVEPHMVAWGNDVRVRLLGTRLDHDEDDADTIQIVANVIADLSGVEAGPDTFVVDCGLASIGIPVLVSSLERQISGLALRVADVVVLQTVGDIAAHVDKCLERADQAKPI